MWHDHADAPHVLDLELTAAPQVLPLSLATAKQHLRVWDDDSDSLIQDDIVAVTQYLDGYAGVMARCLIKQSWTLWLDDFPHLGWAGWLGARLMKSWREMLLPLSPLISVDSVTYADPTGAEQTLDPSTYVVRTGARASFELRRGQTWPDTSRDPRCVAIAFTAGWDASPAAPAEGAQAPWANPASDSTAVPANVRKAMLLMLGDLYENREAIVVAESRVTQIVNPTMDNLLAPHRASWL